VSATGALVAGWAAAATWLAAAGSVTGPAQQDDDAIRARARHHAVAAATPLPPGAHGDLRQGLLMRRTVPPLRIAPDSGTERYEVDGVRVIHRHVTANNVVAANLYLLGGVRQTPAEKSGLEAILLDASERGTRKYPKTLLRRRMASLGSAIVSAPSEDWTLFGLRSTTATFDSTWSVFADRVMAPRLDSVETEQVRSLYATGVRQRRDSPDALLEYLADSAAFSGHPYGLSPAGTEQSIANITLDDLRRYHRDQMVKSRMLLVIVGNVDRSRIERLVRGTLGTLPAGSYRWTLPEPVTRSRSAAVVVSRNLPTNYILGYYSGPSASSPDYPAMRIATAVLSGRMFAEIRSRRNLTYAVDAPFLERALSAGGLYVTTVSPDLTLDLMRAEIDGLRRDQIDPAALDRLVQQFITDYFLDNETNSDQANFLARAELYQGDYRKADAFVDDLRAVTSDDVRRVATRYMRDVTFAYIGDPRKLTPRVVEGF
jgi:zinc protease